MYTRFGTCRPLSTSFCSKVASGCLTHIASTQAISCITDAGYRGHNAPPDHKFEIYTSGQKRRVTPQIKREFNRRAAIEPVIGHLKERHRMGRN